MMMSTKKKWSIAVVVGICVAMFIYFFIVTRWPLPRLTSVTIIKAKVFLNGEKEFDITSDYWPELWDALQPASIDLNPSKWVVLGGLKIKFKDDSVFNIVLFSVSETPGAFKIGSWYYRGGNSTNLTKVLKNAYQATLTAKP